MKRLLQICNVQCVKVKMFSSRISDGGACRASAWFKGRRKPLILKLHTHGNHSALLELNVYLRCLKRLSWVGSWAKGVHKHGWLWSILKNNTSQRSKDSRTGRGRKWPFSCSRDLSTAQRDFWSWNGPSSLTWIEVRNWAFVPLSPHTTRTLSTPINES